MYMIDESNLTITGGHATRHRADDRGSNETPLDRRTRDAGR